jgi:hypothetical protein
MDLIGGSKKYLYDGCGSGNFTDSKQEQELQRIIYSNW